MVLPCGQPGGRGGPSRRALLVSAAGAALLGGCRRQTAGARPLRVAAASDVEPAFRELGDRFTARTGRAVVFSFGSSGALAHQIDHGAPLDLYAAASAEHVDCRGQHRPGQIGEHGQHLTRQFAQALDKIREGRAELIDRIAEHRTELGCSVDDGTADILEGRGDGARQFDREARQGLEQVGAGSGGERARLLPESDQRVAALLGTEDQATEHTGDR